MVPEAPLPPVEADPAVDPTGTNSNTTLTGNWPLGAGTASIYSCIVSDWYTSAGLPTACSFELLGTYSTPATPNEPLFSRRRIYCLCRTRYGVPRLLSFYRIV